MLLSEIRRGAPHSYTLKKVSSVLDAEGFVYKITYYQTDGIYPTGCRVSFPNTDVVLSIQTNPLIAGPNFAQTAILNSEGILYIPSLGYDSVIDHHDLEPLTTHLRELKTALDGRNAVDFPDAEVQTRGPSGGRRRPNPPSPPASQPDVSQEVPSSEVPLSGGEIPSVVSGASIDTNMSALMSILMFLGAPQPVNGQNPPEDGTSVTESVNVLYQLLGVPLPEETVSDSGVQES